MQKSTHIQDIPIYSSHITNNIPFSHAKNKGSLAAA